MDISKLFRYVQQIHTPLERCKKVGTLEYMSCMYHARSSVKRLILSSFCASTIGSPAGSLMGECSFESFDCGLDVGAGEGEGHEGNGPGVDGGAEEIRRVDKEIEAKVRQSGDGLKSGLTSMRTRFRYLACCLTRFSCLRRRVVCGIDRTSILRTVLP